MDEHERAATERKKRVEKYFNRTPAPRELWQALAALGLCGGGLVLGAALASTTTTFLLRVSAISLIVAGVIILLKGGELKWRYDRTLRAAEPKPTDSGMDELLRSDLAAVRDRALDRLGVMTED